MNKVALTIPIYNCATQLIRVLKKVQQLSHDKFETILIIDNQSSPVHIELLSAFLKDYPLSHKVKFFQNHSNHGLGATFKRSWVYLKNNGYDYMVFLHGDDQADLLDFLNFKDKQKGLIPAIAFGARFMRESQTQNYSKRRHMVNSCLNKCLSLIGKRPIWELGSGLNLYRLDVIEVDDILNFSNHIAFDLELLIFCIKNKIEFQFFPISWKSEDEVSTINELKVGFDLLKIMLVYGVLNIRPVQKTQNFPVENGWKELA